MEFTSLNHILKKCEEIKNKKIKDIISHSEKLQNLKNKGAIGNLIQEEVFNIPSNNSTNPDFEKLNIELKVTGLIKNKKKDQEGRKYRAKERISLGMIDYNSVIKDLSFYDSHIYNKIKKTLYIFYEYDYVEDILEWKIIDYKYVELDTEKNIKTIIDDYSSIIKKINDGEAHELSESLSKNLAASVKGSGKKMVKQPNSLEMAKPRAFSWKPSYVNQIFYGQNFEYYESNIIKLINEKISKFNNMSIDDIYNKFELIPPESKNKKQFIFNKILGINKYYEIPNIKQSSFKIKNIEFKDNKKMKEEIGLVDVNINEFIEDISFQDSELYSFLTSYKFLFIIWKVENKKTILKDIMIFEFSDDLIKKAEDVYNDTKEKFNKGINLINKNGKVMNNLIKKRENKGIHLRPHARDGKDLFVTPFGQKIVKQQYWLNSYEVEKKLI